MRCSSYVVSTETGGDTHDGTRELQPRPPLHGGARVRLGQFGRAGRVPLLGLGTYRIGLEARRDAVLAIETAIEAGMRHIDVAELYSGGAVESLVGAALAGRRDDVFLVSKLLPENASREGTVAACERSLRRLRTDRLDCYLLHWLGPHPLEETIAGFEELVEAGKIRSWGVSNFDEVKLDEAVRIAGEGRVACDQVLYHLEQRAVEHAVVPYCQRHEIALVAYSPLGAGRFPDPRSGGGRVLDEIAARHAATPRQVALAFLLRQPGCFAIPKAAVPEHVREDAAAGNLDLDPADVALLDRAFPRGPRRAGVPTP